MPTAPVYTVLFDGHCRFCVASARRLKRLARPGSVHFINFYTPAALDPFPAVTPQACRAGVQLITPKGGVYSGAQAVARLLQTRPLLALLGALYFIPGLRYLLDRAYDLIARNRYRLGGHATGTTCQDGHCAPDLRAPAHPAPSPGKPTP